MDTMGDCDRSKEKRDLLHEVFRSTSWRTRKFFRSSPIIRALHIHPRRCRSCSAAMSGAISSVGVRSSEPVPIIPALHFGARIEPKSRNASLTTLTI